MILASSYLHVSSGRLRVKTPAIKGSKGNSLALEQILSEIPGVISTNANPVTANVLVLFDELTIDAPRILRHLERLGYSLAVPGPKSHQTAPNEALSPVLSRVITKSLLEVAVEVAVQSAVRHVIAALI